MLYSSQDQVENKSNPYDGRAINNLGPVTYTKTQKFLYILLCVITLSIAYFVLNISKINALNRLQNKINEDASNIEVQLEKRYATLTKLVAAVESQAKFNREVYENIAKYRSFGKDDINDKQMALSKIQSGINFAFENYPQLGADESVRKLMTEATMIEKEIAASRRLYNASVNEFNTAIYNFPTNVVVAKKGYHGLNLFKVTEEHTSDVDLSFNSK